MINLWFQNPSHLLFHAVFLRLCLQEGSLTLLFLFNSVISNLLE